ncbi:hypothetical protein [Ornithinibacillus contaminans]|uniref:hypothetical protein n=1 Tax=Ornithinibacillus contaminans TaxID=694055 RepID=UPI00064DDAC6|nr:hypothetical protein [Ornithinibacillus contaminans]
MKKDLKVTWDNNWINEFESPWGVFEKFKYANSVRSEDILSLFSKPKTTQKNNTRECRYSLYTVIDFDDELIQNLMGLSLKSIVENYEQKLCSVFFKSKQGYPEYFKDNMQICEKCLSIGFHSILHQFNLTNTCPYHLTKLRNNCPRCKRRIPYILSDDYISSPFQCICGFMFIKENSIRNIFIEWKKTRQLEIKDKQISEWIAINRIGKSSNTRIYLYHKNTQIESLNSLINHFNFKRSCFEFNSANFTKENVTIQVPELSVLNDNLREEIYKSTRQTFKSIVRYLKKTILYKHKHCINKYKKMFYGDDNCPFAFSFVHWRKNIEGLKNYWEVENGTHLLKKQSVLYFDFASKQDSTFLEEFIILFQNGVNGQQVSKKELIYMINRTMSILIINHFYNWLSYAKINGCKAIHHNGLPLQYKKLPQFLIQFKLNGNSNSISFYNITNNYIESEFTNLKCPNSSNKGN